MEAHHPHHITQQKKWTEYLLEFLMLFLAVFLGFIAENIREHAAEHKRAEQYVKSLLSDLKNDVIDLDRSAAYDSLTNLMIDSLVHFINSGNLRYFSNTELVDKINVYNTTSTAIASVQQIIGTRRERSFQYSDQIFIPECLLLYTQFSTDDILDGEKKRFIDSLKNAAPSLQTNVASAINSFGNAMLATKPNRQFLLQSLYPLAKRSAVEIIELIKKEYHLKGD